MSNIVLATIGSLGDMHPKIALALELKRRGHHATIAAMEFYRPKIEALGIGFAPMAPHLDPDDQELARDLMDARKGSEKILREIIMPNLRAMYDDLSAAVDGADLLITGEIAYAVKSVVERSGVKWVSTSLQPGTFFSAYDPFLPPMAPWFRHLRFLGPGFYRNFYRAIRWTARNWYEPYKAFRRELGLDDGHDPIFSGKYSSLLHLALFSKVLGSPQPDWPRNTVQPGFCFYDGHTEVPEKQPALESFLDSGEPPIVFTLGSAAVMDARDFFDESVKAAKQLSRRAILLYGLFSDPPTGLNDDILGLQYAPYSHVFPRAACVVHQGGVGTTGQTLKAGVPQIIVPFAHDQPDNAARCERLGVARMIGRYKYTSSASAAAIKQVLADPRYVENAAKAGEAVRLEGGTDDACDAIENVL